MATIIIPEKICKACGGTKWVEFKYIYHYNYKNIPKLGYRCSNCSNNRVKKYLKEHPEYIKKYHSSEKGKEVLKRAKRTQIAHLTDYYIKQHIYSSLYNQGYSMTWGDLSQDQIDIVRKSILVQRELKSLRNGTR